MTTTRVRPSGNESVLTVNGLTVGYRLGSEFVRAVDSASLVLHRGRALGIVGESGSGKTTLALALMRLLPSNGSIQAGHVLLAGTRLETLSDEAFRRQIRWKRMAMVFQSAMNSLNPVLRIDRQLRDVYRLHDPSLSDVQVTERIRVLCELVGLDHARIAGYPHEFSGGMRQRVVIAMSLLCDPEIVIADEATTALDVIVQAQILAELAILRNELGLALLVISHDVAVIRATCDDVAVMYAGQIVEAGPVDRVFALPTHPYTAALSAAVPSLTGPRRRLVALPGDPPNLAAQGAACTFADRCPIAAKICHEQDPPTVTVGDQESKCHLAGDERIQSIASGVHA